MPAGSTQQKRDYVLSTTTMTTTTTTTTATATNPQHPDPQTRSALENEYESPNELMIRRRPWHALVFEALEFVMILLILGVNSFLY